MKKGIITTNILNDKEFKLIDKLIDTLTLKAVEKVSEARSFNIMTACLLDKRLVIISEYDLPNELYRELKKQAYILAKN
jgi:hypothetical protein